MYYKLKNDIKVKRSGNVAGPTVKISPEGNKYKDIFYVDGKRHATGLTKPYPEFLFEIYNQSRNHLGSTFLVSKEMLEADFQKLEQMEHGDSITLLSDVKANDNCWNKPEGKVIPKGTTLVAKERWGTRRGEYFFEFDGGRVNLRDLYCPHPEALPVVPPEMFELIRKDA